jgi:hypothetical protein
MGQIDPKPPFASIDSNAGPCPYPSIIRPSPSPAIDPLGTFTTGYVHSETVDSPPARKRRPSFKKKTRDGKLIAITHGVRERHRTDCLPPITFCW